MVVAGMELGRSVAGVALVLALVGCSDDGGGTDAAAGSAGSGTAGSNGASSGAGGNGAGGSGAGASSGGSTSAGSGGAGGSASPLNFGQVLVSRYPGSNQNGTSIGVRFTRRVNGTASTETCTTTTEGLCSVVVCDGAPATPGTATTTSVSAGTVTVTSAELTGSAVVSPDANANYAAPTSSFDTALVGGEHLSISASGGEVPAFQGEVDAPLMLLLSAPAFTKANSILDLPLNADLPLVWTRGAKDVVMWIQGFSVDPARKPGTASLYCQVPSEQGSLTIKANLLQPLGVDGIVNLYTIGSKVITAGDYSVTLAALMPTGNPDRELLTQIHLK